MDIESLYTVIPQDELLTVISTVLKTRVPPQRIPTSFVIELLHLALSKNYFMFQDKFYLQICGTAMGAAMAPDVANLFVTAFESQYIYQNQWSAQIKHWKRYIDDVFIIWQGSVASLLEFHLWLNNLNSCLKFTINYDQHQVAYLDILVTRSSDSIITTLYRKQNELPGNIYPPCTLGHFNLPVIAKEGDVNIGGLFSIHFWVSEPNLSFIRPPEATKCKGFSFRIFRWVQTMIFAIQEINRDKELLPNVSLGYKIYDSCGTHFQSLKAALSLIWGAGAGASNCNCLPLVPVLIGDSGSTQSIVVARLMGIFTIPMVSYFSSCACLSSKHEYPTFLRTVPSDLFQARALAQLVKYFQWSWIGTIAGDDAYGQNGISVFHDEISRLGICVAFRETIPNVQAQRKVAQIVETIRKYKVQVVLVFAVEQYVNILMKEVIFQNLSRIQWIASEAWATSTSFSIPEGFEFFGGTIGFAIHKADISGLEQFLCDIHSMQEKSNPFITEFWEELFQCSFENASNLMAVKKPACTGHETLAVSDNIYFDVKQLRISYNVYKAVYAVAHALHNMQTYENRFGSYSNLSNVEPWQLLQYLKNVNFAAGSGEKVSFDKNGDPYPSYDLINWQQGSNGSILFVNIGQYNDAEEGESKLQIDKDRIVWCGAQKKIPSSVCSESCLPGTRKAVQPGRHLCCFDCIPCNAGEISNQSDSIECIKCPPDFWSNKARDHCVPKELEFISFKEAMGTTLLTMALLGTFLTVAVLSLFVLHRNSPIVKANNSSLSFLILFSLALCFLCSITFIGQPTAWSCMLRHTAFGVSFALCLSCILGKTCVVLIAFKIQHPNSFICKWFGPRQQKMLIFLCTSIQVIICLTWLVISPPWPLKTSTNESSTIILECGVGSVIAFCFVLGYIGFLLSVCFGLAFFARNLPNQFNEAKFITFSLLTSATVWITFVPTYVSAPGKYTVAVEMFAILASSFALLTCIFAPKCYIILLKPEKNSKVYLRTRTSSAKKYKI
ncbi:extracellular calcium-sensing receptor-like [Rhinatrema bivittatum]|uniref:extracellular calcium-sensing receptor-like n=1 Tax=Rhinatrema bivittatum TaxID=194408 RepID=UPI001128CE93|nr:extracellular calcium-sensing receptor-like [Rhinatrema bivittatum]